MVGVKMIDLSLPDGNVCEVVELGGGGGERNEKKRRKLSDVSVSAGGNALLTLHNSIMEVL